jgi:hypothetical protein
MDPVDGGNAHSTTRAAIIAIGSSSGVNDAAVADAFSAVSIFIVEVFLVGILHRK